MIKTKNIPLTLAILLLQANHLFASPLQLLDEPLFLFNSVPPALVVTFDDSGSMDQGWMPASVNWEWDKHSFASPDYNYIYYNPNLNYKPPLNANGTSLPDSDFYNASRDGYYTSGDFFGRVNLSIDYRPFKMYRPKYSQGPHVPGSGNGGTSSVTWEYAKSGRTSHTNPAFYYTWIGPENATMDERLNQNQNYQLHVITTDLEKQNFANWYTYYNTRYKVAKAAISHSFANLGPDFKLDWQQLWSNKLSSKTTNMKILQGSHKQDFYDWLFLVQSPPAGTPSVTPLRRAYNEVGEYFQRTGNTSPYFDASYNQELSCQQNFHISIGDGSWSGYWNSVTGNIDNTPTSLPVDINGSAVFYNPIDKVFSDNNSGSLSDIAFLYWATDLRPDLDNNVQPFISDYNDSQGNYVQLANSDNWLENEELYWNSKNNPATWQHIINYNVGIGVEGSLNHETDLPNLINGNKNWPTTDGSNVCIARNSNGVEFTVTCENHQCYDSISNQGTVIPCSLDLAPVGPIKYCENSDTGSTVSCSERIIKEIDWHQARTDDIWHASVNSRGEFYNANNVEELSEALYNVVSNITQRKGSSSAGSVSSNIVSTNSLVFKTGYDTNDWSGYVYAEEKLANGNSTGQIIWDAGCKLTGGFCTATNTNVSATNTPVTRNIFTFEKNTTGLGGSQLTFNSSNLSTNIVTSILDSNFYTQTNLTLPNAYDINDFVNYLRGDTTLEEKNGGLFRNRNSILGDIIHSSAKIIRGPGESYNDNYWASGSPEQLAADLNQGYTEYKLSNKDRNSIILVGSNDGMLHAFDSGLEYSSNGGHEKWAYIPSPVLNGISELANPLYEHRSFVDAAPIVKDAFINNSWTTIALGGLRHGGKAYYSLDLGASLNSTPSVLWEFTEEDDNDLGYTYGNALITRVATVDGQTSKWVAILPNGYNSTNQKSVMYAVDLQTGELLHKWVTGIGSIQEPNGMGPPVATDFVVYDPANNNNIIYGSDQTSDFVYAGDLAGNIYRFNMLDIFDNTLESSPEVLFEGSTNQPITTSPRVFTPGNGDQSVIVVFGTGKYIELPDRVITGAPNQYIIGLKDSNGPINTPLSLNDNRLIEQFITESSNTRNLTSNAVASNQGWKIKLPTQGERMVNTIGRNNQSKILTIATIIPNAEDPCLPGGQSWLMFLDARTGGVPAIGSVLRNSSADGVLINDIVLGFNIQTSIGGNEQFVNIDTANNDSSTATDLTEQISSNKWRRRSWHRILLR